MQILSPFLYSRTLSGRFMAVSQFPFDDRPRLASFAAANSKFSLDQAVHGRFD
jgi:hypothetical protein